MNAEPSSHYVGQELDLFAHARNWKGYWSSRLLPWVGGDVLEVGAGAGVNTQLLLNPRVKTWECLEPDPALAAQIPQAIAAQPGVRITVGTTATLAAAGAYDCLVYIDVLEHIAGDTAELERAERLLRPGGCVIVLSPAHQILFSEFDKSIGHVRRYSKTSLAACAPPSLALVELYYLDSVGVALSLANRMLLRQSYPTLAQIQFWDRRIIPLSRSIDRWLGYQIGKTVVGVWKSREATARRSPGAAAPEMLG